VKSVIDCNQLDWDQNLAETSTFPKNAHKKPRDLSGIIVHEILWQTGTQCYKAKHGRSRRQCCKCSPALYSTKKTV